MDTVCTALDRTAPLHSSSSSRRARCLRWTATGATWNWARYPAPTARRKTCCTVPGWWPVNMSWCAAHRAGVGSAVVQLARMRGAKVSAVVGRAKMDQVRAIGADQVLDRDTHIAACLGLERVDLVVDNVAGPAFGVMPATSCCGGRYVSSGAIAGPMVTLDMRRLYLNDMPDRVARHGMSGVSNLVAAIERARCTGGEDLCAGENRPGAGRIPGEKARRQLLRAGAAANRGLLERGCRWGGRRPGRSSCHRGARAERHAGQHRDADPEPAAAARRSTRSPEPSR